MPAARSTTHHASTHANAPSTTHHMYMLQYYLYVQHRMVQHLGQVKPHKRLPYVGGIMTSTLALALAQRLLEGMPAEALNSMEVTIRVSEITMAQKAS